MQSVVCLSDSVLLLFSTDIVPENIALATDENKPYNIMPVYGTLCCYQYFILFPIAFIQIWPVDFVCHQLSIFCLL